ncbi:MAG: ribonuclease [Trichococcus sp.]|jgi:ribonuclease HII|nr:ribonuclease [Trichococcus sp.]
MNKPLSIAAIKELLQEIQTLEDQRWTMIQADSRKGVQAAVKSWERNYQLDLALKERQNQMMVFEEELKAKGRLAIAGIDEVGRGPLAGPVVAAAVILPPEIPFLPVNDSKQLSAKKREQLYDQIMEIGDVGIGLIPPETIDAVNIYEATKLAMMQAIANLKQEPDSLLIDAMKLPLPIEQQSIIKGDAKSVSIAAASIVAKVYRDRLMSEYAVQYPHYGFEKNAGYGTQLHLSGLDTHGITPIHRKTFDPIKSMLRGQ